MPTSGGARGRRRRVPSQERSRRRVEALLDAAGRLVAEEGVDAVSTRRVAEDAGIPVATLYQYFADRDQLLLALVERDMREMDDQVARDLGVLLDQEGPTLRGLVTTTMRAYVTVYERRPAFVEIWMRGRTNSAIAAHGREHNRETAATLHELARDLGLIRPEMPRAAAELAVELGDRGFQLAYEEDLAGDRFLLEEGIELVVAYLERWSASPPASRREPAEE